MLSGEISTSSHSRKKPKSSTSQVTGLILQEIPAIGGTTGSRTVEFRYTNPGEQASRKAAAMANRGHSSSAQASSTSANPVTSRDLDSSVEIISERIDVVASILANTNRLLQSIEKSSNAIEGATTVIMWVVIVQFVLGLLGMVFALSMLSSTNM
jgi:hypothetical protein